MSSFTDSAVAAWRLGVRAAFRRRLQWWTVVLAALFWATAEDSRRDPLSGWSMFAGVGTLLVTLAGAGRPGDDLQSGALPADLLAGATPVGLVVGSAAGILSAAAPALLVGVAALGPATLEGGTGAAVTAGAALLATIAWALLAVLGGTLLPGMGAVVVLFPLTIVGGLPPEALPVEQLPRSLADLVQGLWGILPFSHHVSSVASAARLASPGGDAGRHAVVLGAGAVAAGAAAVGVLRQRMVRGRWA